MGKSDQINLIKVERHYF